METQMNTRDAATHGTLPAFPLPWASNGPETAALTLRDWLAHLAKTGRLATIDQPVALEHELAAIAKRLDGAQAAFFTQPGGKAVPVVSGFMSKRGWIAEAMGVEEAGLLARFSAAAAQPVPSTVVDRADAPCQQVVHTCGIDLHALLPIPTHSEHDNGPYITAGLVIARNPRTGVQNVSINRIQVHGANRMAILLLPRHLYAFQKAAEEAGDALDVAVAIGVDPLTMLASQAITPIDHDELEIAGALHGAPLPVVKCVTNGVHIPAFAEIVIEGRILANVREPEGPFGEFPKYYSAKEAREVIEVTAVTHRKDPIFHTIVPAEMEHLLLGAIPREATLLSLLQRSHPGVKDVHLSVGGVCRYHLWVQFEKKREGEAKNVILCAFGAHYDIKQVVVVDTDVDVHNPAEIEWAIATRFQADRDLVVIEGAQGSPLDPSTTVDQPADAPPHLQGVSAKMGLDATRPVVYPEHVFTRVRIPGQDTVDLAALIAADNAAFDAYLSRDHG
jgi:2,5-furandicarboxylate decarboxylase 1